MKGQIKLPISFLGKLFSKIKRQAGKVSYRLFWRKKTDATGTHLEHLPCDHRL